MQPPVRRCGAEPHPLAGVFSPAALSGLTATFLLAEAVSTGTLLLGRWRAGGTVHPAWVLAMPLYQALATAAAIKAVYEWLIRPFWWDKTHHGGFGG